MSHNEGGVLGFEDRYDDDVDYKELLKKEVGLNRSS